MTGLAPLALFAYMWQPAASKPEAALSAEPSVERDPVGSSARHGRVACRARRVDAEPLRRRLAALAGARSYTRRCAALMQLAAVPDSDVPAAEIARYTQPPYDMDVRACAVEALTACQAPGALERLLELSEQAASPLRFKVAHALAARVEGAALERLRALASQPASPWRVPACVALAEAGAPEAVETIAALLGEAIGSDLQELISALGETHDPRALELLEGMRGGASRSVDSAVIVALGAHGSPEATRMLVQRLEQRPSSARAVLHALATSADPGARQLLLRAAAGDDPHIDVDQALEALSGSTQPDVRALMLSGLGQAGTPRRDAAIAYFGEHPDPEAMPALLALAHDRSALGDGTLLSALRSNGGDEAADTLETLAVDEDGELAGEALSALAEMPGQSERARDLALELGERDPASALRVLEAVDPGDSPEARAALLEMTRLPGMGERAIQLLSSRTDADTQRVFAQLARGTDDSRRDAALAALSQSGADSAVAVVREVLRSEDADARMSAVEALGRGLGAKAEADLLAASRDRVPEVSAKAVEQLASIGTPGALSRLEGLVDTHDAAVVFNALSAISSNAPERVAPAVDRILASGNTETLLGAVRVARQLEPAQAARVIEHALRQPDPNLAVDAIDQLGFIADDRSALIAQLRHIADDRGLPSRARDYAREMLDSYVEEE